MEQTASCTVTHPPEMRTRGERRKESDSYEINLNDIWLRKLVRNDNFNSMNTSRQGNNEEQAHTRNKGTNEHDWKETAIFLETSINT
jgi:hypothetical protein